MNYTLQPTTITQEELRSIVLEFITQPKDGAMQFNDLRFGVARLVEQRGLIAQQPEREKELARRYGGARGGDPVLSDRDQARSIEIIWDLIIEGVVRPGPGLGSGSDQAFPFFYVTEYGKQVIKGGNEFSPYDYDGYLKKLQEAIPAIDNLILVYLNESLRTFRIGCLLSSTITLGCASEKALLLLVNRFVDYLAEPASSNFRKKTRDKMIKVQFDALSDRIQAQLLPILPREIKEHLDIALTSLFALFRAYRNEAGHPTGKIPSRDEAYANLRVFPHYVQNVYALMGWLRENPQQASPSPS